MKSWLDCLSALCDSATAGGAVLVGKLRNEIRCGGAVWREES